MFESRNREKKKGKEKAYTYSGQIESARRAKCLASFENRLEGVNFYILDVPCQSDIRCLRMKIRSRLRTG